MSFMRRPEFWHCPSAWRGYEIPAEHSTMKESPMTKLQAEIATRQLERYKTMYQPVFAKYIRNVQQLDNPQRLDQAGDMAQSGIVAQTEPAVDLTTRRLALEKGAGPGSGASVMADSALRRAAAKGASAAEFTGKMGQEDAKLSGLANVVSIGNLQGSQAQTTMGTAANLANEQAQQKIVADLQEQAGLGSALGTAGGIVVGDALYRQRAA